MVFPHSITFEHMQITFVTPVHPSCLSSWTQCHLCRPGCSMHRPTVTRVTPLFHLFVWHFGGTAWCLVLLRKEGDKIEKSFLLSFVSLCLARLDPPPPTVSICSSLRGAGWGGGGTCRNTDTHTGCKQELCTHTTTTKKL